MALWAVLTFGSFIYYLIRSGPVVGSTRHSTSVWSPPKWEEDQASEHSASNSAGQAAHTTADGERHSGWVPALHLLTICPQARFLASLCFSFLT